MSIYKLKYNQKIQKLLKIKARYMETITETVVENQKSTLENECSSHSAPTPALGDEDLFTSGHTQLESNTIIYYMYLMVIALLPGDPTLGAEDNELKLKDITTVRKVDKTWGTTLVSSVV